MLKSFLTFIITAVFLIQALAANSLLVEGQVAPAFSLQDQNAKWLSLKDYRGKWLVLYFYPKDDTPGCTTEACQFRDDIFKIRALNATVLGVSMDDSRSHEAFAKKYSLPFSLLADVKGDVSVSYGSLRVVGHSRFSKRQTFIIDPQGVVRKIYRHVNPDKHSQQVIADLRALKAGLSGNG